MGLVCLFVALQLDALIMKFNSTTVRINGELLERKVAAPV
jgi:hypothetical protein